MRNPLAPAAARTVPLRKALAIAGLALLAAGCARDTPVSPTDAVDLAVSERPSLARAPNSGDASCVPDSKLIGRIALRTEDVPGTWWNLTRQGMDAAGMTNYEVTMERWFGREFANLDEAIAFLVEQASTPDANGNGYVCAYTVRGTRANYGEPNVNLVLFYSRDDDYHARQ